jgi:hypothetical protein
MMDLSLLLSRVDLSGYQYETAQNIRRNLTRYLKEADKCDRRSARWAIRGRFDLSGGPFCAARWYQAEVRRVIMDAPVIRALNPQVVMPDV